MKRPGRNEPCHCGSGKKFKQCCALHDEALASNANAEAASQKFHVSQALQVALGHHQAGRLLQAEEIYRQILKTEPNHPEALHLLGVLAHQAGQNEIAADLINKAIQADPKNSKFHDHLGTVYQALNRLDEAVACHQQALALKPDEAETHYNLGNTYNNLGKLDEAVACYQKALALKHDYAEAYNNLGNTFRGQGKLDDAIVSFRSALAINPNYADAYNNLGGVFNDQRKLDEAIACGRQAVALKPDSAEVHNSLGNALCNQGQISEAIASYRTALEIDREFSKAHSNLGMALCYQGQISEAIASYRTALEIDCGFSSAHSNLIFTLDMAAGFDTPTLQQERKRWGEIHAAPLSAKQRPHTNAPAPDRRLRIGYVSADFRRHSAATAFESMLVKFDRSCFEVVAYSNTINEDQHTQLFQQNVTRWRNIVGLSDDAVAEMIREDGIDILVDLSGHTAGNRLLVFARKPAPVQVTAWGGPSGTGMPAMDALFADPVVIPPEEKQFYMEQVRYLPNLVGFFSQETFPTVGALPALSAKTITFGSFNRLAKVSRESFELWARVLTAVPGSRLMLKTAEFDDSGTRERISRHFTDMGIDPERIVILGKTPWQEHMEAFNQVDIALDPFPQGGGTTALEGLMMGVPIVTLRWPTFGGRASASILTTLGLTDWVAETPEQYLEIAIAKARDLAALADIRQDLRGRFMSSAIGDADIYVKAVETEYRHLWQEWCGNFAPNAELHESAAPVAEMPHATPTLQAALAHHQAGRLLQAEEIYQQILQAEPNHQEALHLLGMLAHQSGQSEIALELINYAIQVNPANPLFHHNLGSVYQALNRLDEAAACYQTAIALKPDYAEAHNNLGNTFYDQGKLDAAAASYQAAIAIDPNYIEAHNNLGTTFNEQGKLDEAVACYQQALALNPDFAGSHYNLGITLKSQGKLAEALTCFQKTIEIQPNLAEAYNNLGTIFNEQEKPEEAAACLRNAIDLNPNYAVAYNNLGIALNCLGKSDDAVACYQRALEIKPDEIETNYNLGNAYRGQGKLDEAVACYQKALALKPNYAEAHCNLGITLCSQGQISEAIASYRTALEIDCGFSSAHSNLIFTLDMAAGFDTPTLQQERKRWGEIHAAPLSAKQRPHTNAPAPDRRLRIGYVSADFIRHSAATAFGAMLVKFNRDRFEVIAYSNLSKNDQYTRLFRLNVTRWRKIAGLSDDAVAEMIREDGIDILVDLSGHSAGNRLLVFARKPAPVQVTAWGYPSGTGMLAMDALFADPVVIPPEEKQFYTEQVRYLPNLVGFFSPETFPTVGALPALSTKTITFGSFNRLAKVSRESFELWARVLTAVPGSRLILKTAEFDDAGTRERVSRHFTAAGIAPERIVMLGKTPWQEHMEAFNQVDIALDPFPQGGGVTALEGLMMGVPIVTLRWPTFGGRASASILTTLGLTDWIAETQEQYLEIAIDKAQNLKALTDLRLGLRDRFTASAIGNSDTYIKAVETEYRQLWQEWCGTSASGSISGPHESTVPVVETLDIPPALQAALAHHQAGRLLQAEEIYQQILQAEPNHQEALHLLGMLAHQSGQSEIALELINYAIQVNPANPLFHHNLGSVYQALNRLDEAAACYQTAIALKPDYAEAHNNLGNTLYDQGKLDAAITSYQAAIAIDPKYIEAHNNLGTTFNEQGKLDEAVACYRQALALNPNFAGSHYNLGITLKSQGKLAEALTCFQKTIEIQPNLAEAHNNMGITLHDLGKLEEAVVYLQNAIALKPDYAEAHCNLGNLLCAMGKMAEAIACYRTSIKIKPGKAHSNLIFALDLMSEADTSILQGERKKWGEIHAAPLTAKQISHANPPDPDRRLRIGYVSADFRQHSAATAFGSMLVRFDQVHFDVIAYSNTIKEDSYTQMFRQQVTRWRNIVGLSDDAVAELIREDGIDILVDLSGHSAGNRLLAFARKPAPIQVTAWGYPSGTGMQAMDVLFADPVVIPPDEKHLYMEDVRYLPNLIGYFNPETFPAMEVLPALSAKGITFGSFNRLAKLSLETFDLWAQLLLAIPDSNLLFKSSEFDTPEARNRVSRHFTGAGIAPERIVMLGKTSWHKHMAAFNRIDVALDPFPHSGGITTLEGMMMGVPTLTLRRPSFGGRASASILTTLGMADWVAETPAQYIAIAIEKTRNLEALANLRGDLRGRFKTSAIGDAGIYVKAAESEYRQLWREWCERQQSQRQSSLNL